MNTYKVYESLSGWYHTFLKLNTDTISIYNFDSDTVDYYSWDTEVENNNILQRYDLGLNDLNDLLVFKYTSILYFPPTDAMKHIRMWPPYGTYDEH